eukprot:3374-Chlamydomonas_euryale.AAC.3
MVVGMTRCFMPSPKHMLATLKWDQGVDEGCSACLALNGGPHAEPMSPQAWLLRASQDSTDCLRLLALLHSSVPNLYAPSLML